MKYQRTTEIDWLEILTSSFFVCQRVPGNQTQPHAINTTVNLSIVWL